MALVVTIGLLVVWNLSRSSISAHWLLGATAALTAILILIGVAGGLGADELGLRPDRVLAGLRYGCAVTGMVLVALLAAHWLPVVSNQLDDPRVRVSAGQMLYQVLVVIPLGTVVVEEVAFRGTLLGLLRNSLTDVRAVVVSSVLFGLWHINSVVLGSNGGATEAAAAAAGTFAATTAAGIGFAWLRLRSDSLVAPMCAHLATNSLTFAVAWTLTR